MPPLHSSSRRAFTLLETVVTVAIISLVFTAAVVALKDAKDNALGVRISTLRKTLSDACVRAAMDGAFVPAESQDTLADVIAWYQAQGYIGDAVTVNIAGLDLGAISDGQYFDCRNVTSGGGGPIPSGGGTVAVSANNITVDSYPDSTANAVFTITLSSVQTSPITVNYNTVDGTATVANGDYLAASGSVTFSPGEEVETVPVTIPPRADGPPVNFTLALSNTDSTTQTSNGLATIVSGVSNNVVGFTTPETVITLTEDYVPSNSDMVDPNSLLPKGTDPYLVAMLDGQTDLVSDWGLILVQMQDSEEDASDEESLPPIAQGGGLVYGSVTMNRTGNLSGSLTVGVQADYVGMQGYFFNILGNGTQTIAGQSVPTVIFAPGSSTAEVVFTVDPTMYPWGCNFNTTPYIVLTPLAPANVGTMVYTSNKVQLLFNGTPLPAQAHTGFYFSQATQTAPPVPGTLNIGITRVDDPGSTVGDATVQVSFGGQGKWLFFPWNTQTADFPQGVTSQTLQLTYNGDYDGTDYLMYAYLGNPSNGTEVRSPAVDAITIDQSPQTFFQMDTPSVEVPETAGSVNILVDRVDQVGGVGDAQVTVSAVSGTATDPTNYNFGSATVDFPPGQMQASVSIPILATGIQGHLDFQVQLSNPTNGAQLGTLPTTAVRLDGAGYVTPPGLPASTGDDMQYALANFVQTFQIAGGYYMLFPLWWDYPGYGEPQSDYPTLTSGFQNWGLEDITRPNGAISPVTISGLRISEAVPNSSAPAITALTAVDVNIDDDGSWFNNVANWTSLLTEPSVPPLPAVQVNKTLTVSNSVLPVSLSDQNEINSLVFEYEYINGGADAAYITCEADQASGLFLQSTLNYDFSSVNPSYVTHIGFVLQEGGEIDVTSLAGTSGTYTIPMASSVDSETSNFNADGYWYGSNFLQYTGVESVDLASPSQTVGGVHVVWVDGYAP
jgi:prepilin-type N-terminal cleavage/methylation domain-containing protein